MATATGIVTLFGGSGFVGRYVAQRMARAGWRVRVACRRPNEAHFVRPYGVVGQVEPILANIRDDASTRQVIQGADAVVNSVGILVESGRQRFDAIHADAAGRVADAAAMEGVRTLVHLSALGSDPDSQSHYGRTKAEGERRVLAAFPDAVILRPSIIFGPEDQFFNRFARMARFSPVLPLVGRRTRFQPVYVDDVAAAVEAVICGRRGHVSKPGPAETGDGEPQPARVYELGGPEVESFSVLMGRMLQAIRRRRLRVSLPFAVAGFGARMLDIAQLLSGGLFVNHILTEDQVRQLRRDNVVRDGALTLEHLGITPTAMDSVLDEYLYCHRPHGQFTLLTESAKNLDAER